MVIDPEGRVVSSTIRPEQLKSGQLLALADGKPVTLGGDADPKVKAELDAAMAQAMSVQSGKATDSGQSLFEIRMTPGDPASGGKRPDTHAMLRGPGRMDITNASPADLLSYGTGVPSARIHLSGDLPDAWYNLHVEAPDADAKQLSQAVETAIASGAHMHIEHHTDTKDAWVLTAKPGAEGHFIPSAHSGGAFYSAKKQAVQCLNATADQLAGALEEALGVPVVNETGLSGKLLLTIAAIAPKNPASASEALTAIGLTLVQAKRPIETVILSAAPDTSR
jgi:uncharacterized protein (TIGR03435 family)